MGPFDAGSFASSFSFRSANSSIRSKAEVKSYGVPSNTQQNRLDRMSEQAECKKLDEAEMKYQEKTEKYNRVSEESPRSTGTPSSESFESITPNTTSPTPEDDLAAEEERAERRKPWKKRKRVQERDLEQSSPEKTAKMEDSNESPDCQDQLDASTSDQN